MLAIFLTLYLLFLVICVFRIFALNKNLDKKTFLLSFISTTFLYLVAVGTSLILFLFLSLFSESETMGTVFRFLSVLPLFCLVLVPTFFAGCVVVLAVLNPLLGIIFCAVYYILFVAEVKLVHNDTLKRIKKNKNSVDYKIVLAFVNKLIRLSMFKEIEADNYSLIYGITIGLFINITTNAVPALIYLSNISPLDF